MPEVTIITPSIRPKGLILIAKALKHQTFKNWEWLICSPKSMEKEIKDILSPFNISYKLLSNPPLKKGQFWDLNFSYNRLFKEAKAELIVSWQDWIYIPPSGLQQFWDNYLATGKKAVISGVGDQYAELNEQGKPHIKIWSDPRKTTRYGTFYECVWNDIEWNWTAIPRALFFAVGGMDEQLDFLGYGGDQLQTCDRLNTYGAKFYLDQTNESYTLRHGRDAFGGQEHWDEHHVLFNNKYHERKQELIEKGLWPILQTDTKYAIKEKR